MKGFYYVYILASQTGDELHYTGVTRDINSRLAKQGGKVRSYVEAHSVENRNGSRIPISAALESCGKEEVPSGDSLAIDNVGFEKSQAHGCFSWHSF